MAAKKNKTPYDANRGEVLVAILNNKADFAIVQEQGWYRIPVESAPKQWPPQWVAFYQTKIFGAESYKVIYYGRVREIRVASRHELFPDEPPGDKSERHYYQVYLERLEQLSKPIISRRFRLIVFIPTTWQKFTTAVEINDLFDESPLEDVVWAELKRLNISAERQMDVKADKSRYFLDFALYCQQGKIDVEADGDKWHAERERIPLDNERNNALAAHGWHVLRFNGQQIRETMAEYCPPNC